MTLTRIRLTKAEAEIIGHRLAVSDAIADALEWDGENFESGYHREDIEDALDAVKLDGTTLVIDDSNLIAVAILRDCVEGSTWKAGCQTAQQYAAAVRVEESLLLKLLPIIGEAEFPE